MENNVITAAFTKECLRILEILMAQAAISLENSQLYENLEKKVLDRTVELNTKNLELFNKIEEVNVLNDNLKRTQEQLIQSQKLESIGKLVSGIAHEFNNLLGGILGFSGLLKRKLDKSSSEYSYVLKIEKSAEHASDLTQKMPGFARKDSFDKKIKLIINKPIAEAVSILERTLSSGTKITCELNKSIWPITADSN